MKKIPTVLGTVETSKMGFVLTHEHITFRYIGEDQYTGPYISKAFDFNLSNLIKAKEVGINTIMECTPWPNVDLIYKLNKIVPDINIILSTGSYIDGAVPVKHRGYSFDEIKNLIIKNITVGFDNYEETGIKAAFIKIGSRDKNLTEWEKMNFRAASYVQNKYNVPIAVHSFMGCKQQMDYLLKYNANISLVYFAHVEAKNGWEGRNVKEQAEYLKAIVKQGGYLQMNNFGFEFDTPIEDFLYLLNYMEDIGFGDHILLSIDSNIEKIDENKIYLEAEAQYPETGKRIYSFIVTDVIPFLIEKGITQERINNYFINNPKKFWDQ
jgi:phosphotriesterase-related protein